MWRRLLAVTSLRRRVIYRKEPIMADRRSGKGPYVPDEGGGKQPRSRNKDGAWRRKRSDAKPKPKK
jgi:hypothetical protein